MKGGRESVCLYYIYDDVNTVGLVVVDGWMVDITMYNTYINILFRLSFEGGGG